VAGRDLLEEPPRPRGIPGCHGHPIALFAIVDGPARDSDEAVLLIAGIMLVIGTALFGLGHSLQQLLDREPDDHV
jgi:hypothetical protein